jgi:type IV pilus assembly protein PilA
MRSQQKGFSLIELLIVVAIILIIAAMATPSYLRSRLAANEASAVGSIRMFNSSAITYFTTYPDKGFPASLAVMSGPEPCNIPTAANACLIDQFLASGTKSGYTFAWTGDGNTPSVAYAVTGTPISVGTTGRRMFCSDQSAAIRFDPSGAGCTNVSDPLQ